jgi:hypothetical protein
VLDRRGHWIAGLRRDGTWHDQGLALVVADIEQARADLVGRGVEVGAIEDVGGGVKYASGRPRRQHSDAVEVAWRTGDKF